MLLFARLVGTWKLLRSENRTTGVMLASAWIVLFLLAYFWLSNSFGEKLATHCASRFARSLLGLAASYIVAHGLARRSLTHRFYGPNPIIRGMRPLGLPV
jgi:hypothetical protein